MSYNKKFTYPFSYIPSPEIVAEANRLISKIDKSVLFDSFKEGKMLGVLMYALPDGGFGFLHAYSGTVNGSASLDGFVPPIYDTCDPDGYFKQEEAHIVNISRRIAVMDTGDQEREALIEERRRLSEALQDWLFEHYIVHNALGEQASIKEIFARRGLVPPGGTGDCAGPRLLEAAYRQGLKPLAMGEFWYGRSPVGEVRRQGRFYPSCFGKCGPLLSFMLEGLDVEDDPLSAKGPSEVEILYEDDYLIVIDKPSGILSVPGRSSKNDIMALLSAHNGGNEVFSCHRLDMDTSGLMVYAKTPEVKSAMEGQFARRETVKRYRARLVPEDAPEGPENAHKTLASGDSGTVDLPLALDYYDRPRQMVDFEKGKRAVTEYKVLAVNPDGSVEMEFRPLTGRSHQLRVHAAHPLGLGRPILGDRLYGGNIMNEASGAVAEGSNLYLQAVELGFTHPVSGQPMHFTLPCRWD